MEEREEDESANENVISRFSEAVTLLLVTVIMIFFFVKFIYF